MPRFEIVVAVAALAVALYDWYLIQRSKRNGR